MLMRTLLVMTLLLTSTSAHAACWNMAAPRIWAYPTADPAVYQIIVWDQDSHLVQGFHVQMVFGTRMMSYVRAGNGYHRFAGPGRYFVRARDVNTCGRYTGKLSEGGVSFVVR